MIARRIPMRNASKSRVVRLAKYLEDKKSSSRVQDVTMLQPGCRGCGLGDDGRTGRKQAGKER